MELYQSLKLHASRHPLKTALVFDGESWSYQQLFDRVCRLMNGLRELGFGGKAEKIAILSANQPDYIVAYYAISGIESLPAPINYRLTEDDVAYVIEHLDSSALFIDSQFSAQLNHLQSLVNVTLLMGNEWSDSAVERYDSVDQVVARSAADMDPDWRGSSRLMMHTSGTTGKPKGALRSKFMFELRALEQGFGPTDRTLCVLPICLGAGFTYTFMSLYVGATVYLLPGFDAEKVMDLFEQEQITATFLLPTMLRDLIDHPRFENHQCSSLRTLQSGAGYVDNDIRQTVVDKYGYVLGIFAASTETGPYANLSGRDVLRTQRGNCVGRPFLGVEIKLIDDDGKYVKQGETGEIWARSDSQFEGYYKDAELTAEVIKNGWVSVGDLGWMDDEGYLYFAGRKRDIIKTGGINVYAPEVEEVIREIDGVADCACIGLPDRRWIELICAVIVPAEGVELSEQTITDYCHQQMAKYKCPKRILFLDQLPANLTGRVMKNELTTQVMAQLGMREDGES